jgi:hypothetical protein
MKYGALLALCALSSPAFAQPAAGQVEPNGTWPPPEAAAAQVALPQPAAQPQAQTRATFVSTGEQKWDVWIDQQPACATPCTLGVMPLQFVALRSQERNPIRLDVGYLPQGDLMVSARPLENGLYAGGIIMTTFAGMGLATGITLTAVGCSTDHPNLCKAGIITAVPSAVGLYLGMYWMRKALPRAAVERAQPYVAANQVGVAGTF